MDGSSDHFGPRVASLTIGKFRFEPQRNCLTHDEGEQALEPKVADLLARLAESPGEVLSRATLLDDVWGTRIGSDESLTRAVSLLRKAFRADEGTTYIETVPKRGYCLSAPVSADVILPGAPEEAPLVEKAVPQSDEAASAPERPEPASAASPSANAEPAEPAEATHSTERAEPAEAWPIGRVLAVASQSFFKVSGAVVLAVALIAAITIVVLNNHAAGGGKGGVALTSIVAESAAGEEATALIERDMATVLIANGVDHRSDPDRASLHVSGTIDGSGEDLRASIEIINAATGDLVWSDTLNVGRGGAEALADEVLGRVGANLGCVIRGFDVWDMAARFVPVAMRYCAAARAHPDGVEHVEAAEALLDMAPDNASVWAAHAFAHARWTQAEGLASGGPSEVSVASLDRAREIAIAKDEATLQFARAMLTSRAELGFTEREALLRTAAHENGPLRNEARVQLARQYIESGRLVEAEPILRRIEGSDPAHPSVPALRALIASLSGEDPELAQDPSAGGGRGFEAERFGIALFAPDPSAATRQLEEGRRGLSRSLGADHVRCADRFLAVRRGEASGLERECEGASPILQARMLASLGDQQAAAASLDWVTPRHATSDLSHLFSAPLAPSRGDPRYWEALKKVGLLAYYQEMSRWPDFCAESRFAGHCRRAAASGI